VRKSRLIEARHCAVIAQDRRSPTASARPPRHSNARSIEAGYHAPPARIARDPMQRFNS